MCIRTGNQETYFEVIMFCCKIFILKISQPKKKIPQTKSFVSEKKKFLDRMAMHIYTPPPPLKKLNITKTDTHFL